MFWNNPWAFLGLLAIPAVWFYFSRRTRRQNAEIERLFSNDMLRKLFTPQSRLSTALKNGALGLAAVALVFVLAEPKMGLEEESRSSLGRDVFVLFDVSESMLAEDVAPNRLSVAKLDVEDLLNSMVGDRIGLIAFAGAPQVEIPLTTDYVFFRDLLREIDVSTARFGGTAIGDAVRLALKRFGDAAERERSIILVTDGEDHDSLPLEAARDAAKLGVPIYAIAIGDLQGAPIPIFDVAGRRVGDKTFDGEKISSKPDVATLKEMAKISGGRYYYADSTLNLAEVYRTSVDRQKRTALEEKNRVVLKDRYQPFLAVALFAFAFAYFLPTRWRRARSSNRSNLTQASTFLLAFSFAVPFAFAQESTKIAPEDDAEKGVAATKDVAEKSAASEKKLSKRETLDAYNRALGLYAEGKTEEAAAILSDLTDVSSAKVADRANFNLGALATAQALAKSKELVEDADKKEESSDETTADSQEKPEKPDFVAKYERERQKREELRREVRSKAEEATRRFRQTSRDQGVASTARENAKSTVAWLEQTRRNERERELKLRAEALVDPADRLRWLQEETSRKIEKTQRSEKRSSQSSFYRDLFEEGRALEDLETDAADVAANLTAQIQASSTTQDAQGGALNVGADPEEDARRVKEALAEFSKRREEAAKNFANYDVESARKELRRAQTQLTALRDAPARYDELAKNLASQEAEKSKIVSTAKAAQFDDAQREDYYWKQDALNCSALELLRKAKKIAQEAPAPDAKSTETNESEVETSSERNEEKTNENETEAARDEIVFDDNLPEKSDNSASSQQESEQEKIRRSAQIALDSEQDLLNSIQKSKNLVDKGKLSDADAKTLEETQKNIEQIMQEIVRPLQDQNQQNQQNRQNQQNSNDSNQSDSQNSKKSDQNQESKDQKNQDRQDRQDDEQEKSEQEKDESQEEEEKRQEQKKQNSATTSEEDPTQKKEEQAPEPEKTQAQKEADSFVRLVEQRQKEAEQIRRAIRTSQQRREKSGKDW